MTADKGGARSTQVEMIDDALNRDRWLAGEIDAVDARSAADTRELKTTLTRVLWALGGVLISTTTTAITLVLTSLAP